jgi:hypothetical protein
MAKGNVAQSVEAASEKSRNKFPLMVVGLLMLVEGVGVYLAVTYFMPEPTSAMAAGAAGMGEAQTPNSAMAEVELAECRPVNKETGKLISIQIRVSALVMAENLEKAKTAVEANQTRVEERVNVVIRSAEPQFLNEPGLQTIKRRLKVELNRLFGNNEELIREVLVPEFIQSGSGV